MIRNKIFYLILLFVLWLLRVLYAFRSTAVLLCVFLALPVVLLLLLILQTTTTKIEVCLEKRITEKKTPFRLEFKVTPRLFLPPGKIRVKLRYRNAAEPAWKKQSFSFFCSGGKNSYYLTLNSEYCAEYEFQIRSLRFFDYLGLFSLPKWLRAQKKKELSVAILPHLRELSENPVRQNPYVMVEGELYSDSKSGDDSTEIFQIREYVEGDRMNRIHWKLSAKEDQLMVKEFGQPIDCSVLILLDAVYSKKAEKQLEQLDAELETALSLSYRLVCEGQIHYLAWFDTREKNITRCRITDEEEFYAAAGELLHNGFAKREENVPLYYLAEYEKEQYTNIFFVTWQHAQNEGAKVLTQNRKSAWLSLYFVGREKEILSMEEFMEDGVTVAILSPDELESGVYRMPVGEAAV